MKRSVFIVVLLCALLAAAYFTKAWWRGPAEEITNRERDVAANVTNPVNVAASGPARPQAPAAESARRDASREILKIIYSDGHPAAGADVFFIDPAAPVHADFISMPPSVQKPSARTNDAGECPFDSKYKDHWLVVRDPISKFTFFQRAEQGRELVLGTPKSARVKVVDYNHKPIEGARVALRRIPYSIQSHGGLRYYDNSPAGRALSAVEEYLETTNSDGIVTITGQLDGLYRHRVEGSFQGNLEFTSEMAVGSEFLVVMDPISIFRGIVKNKNTGEPVANAHVIIVRERQFFEAASDSAATNTSGEFEIRAPLRGARGVFAIVSAAGFADAAVDLQEMNPTSPLHKEILLTNGIEISGIVQSDDAGPVAGAMVFIVASETDQLIAQKPADGEGHYRFDSVREFTKYRISASAPGYDFSWIEYYKSDPAPKPIVMAAGGELNIQFTIPPPSRGTEATAAIRKHEPKSRSLGAPVAKKVNIKNGPAVIQTNGPGQYHIYVDAAGFAPAVAENVDVKPRERTTVNIILNEGASVSGIVMAGKEKTPIAGCGVVLLGPPAYAGVHGEPTSKLVFTGADGKYVLSGIPPGESELLVSAAGLAPKYIKTEIAAGVREKEIPATTLYKSSMLRGKVKFEGSLPKGLLVNIGSTFGTKMSIDPDTDGSFWFNNLIPDSYSFHITVPDLPGALLCITHVDVPEGEDVQLEIPFGAAAVRGKLRGAVDPPAEHWTVSLLRTDSNYFSYCPVSPDGSFQFAGVPPGIYPFVAESLAGSAQTHASRNVNLRGGMNELQFDLSGILYEIIVKDTKGEPVPDVDVRIRPVDSPLRRTVPAAFTNKNGVAKIQHIEPAEYKVSLNKAGYESAPRWSLRAEATGNNKSEFVLPRESPLSIRIVDIKGKPASGASAGALRLDNPFAGDNYISADAASVVLFKKLGAAEYQITARASGYFPSRGKVKLESEKPLETTITVDRARALKVTVQSGAGAPIEGVPVVVEANGIATNSADWIAADFTKTAPAGARTAKDGTLQFDSVPASSLTVRAAGASATVEASEKAAELTLILP